MSDRTLKISVALLTVIAAAGLGVGCAAYRHLTQESARLVANHATAMASMTDAVGRLVVDSTERQAVFTANRFRVTDREGKGAPAEDRIVIDFTADLGKTGFKAVRSVSISRADAAALGKALAALSDDGMAPQSAQTLCEPKASAPAPTADKDTFAAGTGKPSSVLAKFGWSHYPMARPEEDGVFEVIYVTQVRTVRGIAVYSTAEKRFIASGDITDRNIILWRRQQTEDDKAKTTNRKD